MGLLALLIQSLFTESLILTLAYFLVPVLILSGIDRYFDEGSIMFWKIALQNSILFLVGAVMILILYIVTPKLFPSQSDKNPYLFILLPAACVVFLVKWYFVNSSGLTFSRPYAIIIADTLILTSLPIIISFRMR